MSVQSRVTSRGDVVHSGRENLHQFLPILLRRHAHSTLSDSIMRFMTLVILASPSSIRLFHLILFDFSEQSKIINFLLLQQCGQFQVG